MMTWETGTSLEIASVARMPSIPGMLMSMRTMSGCSSFARSMALGPSSAPPTISTSSSNWSSLATLARASAKSSTTRTRILPATFPHNWRVCHAPARPGPWRRLLAPVESVLALHVLNRDRRRRLDVGVARRAQHEVHVRLPERHQVLQPFELQRRVAVDDEGDQPILGPVRGLLVPLGIRRLEHTYVVDAQVLEQDPGAQVVGQVVLLCRLPLLGRHAVG